MKFFKTTSARLLKVRKEIEHKEDSMIKMLLVNRIDGHQKDRISFLN